MTIYGLANCDTTKAATKWLKQHQQHFDFHDYKIEGITEAHLSKWLTQIPLEKLLNKKSTTWRGLTPKQQATADDVAGAIQLMKENTNLIKRPLIEWPDGVFTVGYDAAVFEERTGV